ncbi:MAG: hypothetical protein JWP48_3913 [Actinoallomurus sp.]|jgi:hypothetical protein|nr:hypothetical protein [Actinoallomurus sp.]
MTGRKRNARARHVLWLVTAVCAGMVALCAPAGRADTGPSPQPGGRSRTQQDHTTGRAGQGGGRRTGHHRPRSVVRCQNDETDQLDEFDDEDGEPRHSVAPSRPDAAGHCVGSREALQIAGLLGGARPAAPRR